MANLKARKERIAELEQAIETEFRAVETGEQRNFTEQYDEKVKELERERETVKKLENRSNTIKIEKGNSKMENAFTQEMENRAIAQYLRGEMGEELRVMVTESAGPTVPNATKSGALVPTHLSNNVIQLLNEVAPLFGMIPKVTPVNGTLEILKETNIGNAGFVGEMKNLTPNDFTTEKVKLEQRRAGSAIELSQHLINDSGIDIVSYSKEVLFRRLGYALDMAVVNGDKETSFEGLIEAKKTYPSIKVEQATSGDITIDDFMNVMNAMHPTLQQDAVWIMSRKLFNQVQKLKDGKGDYYMTRQLNIVDNKPEYRLFGHKIFIHEGVPVETSVGTPMCFFVNFAKAYAGMVKRNVELKNISLDTLNALRGSHTFTLDVYADVKVVDEKAIKCLVRK